MDKPTANPLLGKESERCQEKKRSGGKLDADQYIDLMVNLTDQYIVLTDLTLHVNLIIFDQDLSPGELDRSV